MIRISGSKMSAGLTDRPRPKAFRAHAVGILGLLVLTGGLLWPGSAARAGGLITSGLALDLEASKGVTTGPSGNVISWADQSGNGHDATQSNTALQPVLVNNAVNGGPALAFNGNGDFLNVAGQVITSQQFTILALVTDTSTSTGFREIFSNWDTTSFEQSIFLGDTSQNPVRVRFTDDMGGVTDPLHNQTGVGTVSDPSSPFVLTGVSGATDASVYQNDTQIADHGSALSTRNLTETYRIGTQGGSMEFWTGDIAAILVYNRALSVAEIRQDVMYLQGVPEPSSLVLAGTGALVVLSCALQRRRRT